MMAGRNRGTWFVPEVGDEVLVAFEHGDVKEPYVIGALWKTRPPAESPADVKLSIPQRHHVAHPRRSEQQRAPACRVSVGLCSATR